MIRPSLLGRIGPRRRTRAAATLCSLRLSEVSIEIGSCAGEANAPLQRRENNAMPTLVIANKCYSSWSLRPWLLLKQLSLAFGEVLIPLDQPDTTVWESIAIMDHVGETYEDAEVWPRDPHARAVARSVAAEMHAGFGALRSACPMNLGKRFAQRDRGEAVVRDVARVTEIWRNARGRFGAGGPFLFGDFSAADAMYAPVVTRFDTYAIAVDPVSRVYMDTILALPAFREWRDA